MHRYLFEHPDAVTQQQLDGEMLPLLPEWRRCQALAFRHLLGRVQCAKAFLLLAEGLARDYGINGDLAFDYLAHGKPVLRHYPDIHFNISHSSKGILCVIDDIGEVGCDIEDCGRRFSDALLHRCCSADEFEAVRSAADPSAAFAALWTRKEAVVKLTGLGLEDPDLPGLLSPHRLEAEGIVVHTEGCLDSGYCYSVAHYKRH